MKKIFPSCEHTSETDYPSSPVPKLNKIVNLSSDCNDKFNKYRARIEKNQSLSIQDLASFSPKKKPTLQCEMPQKEEDLFGTACFDSPQKKPKTTRKNTDTSYKDILKEYIQKRPNHSSSSSVQVSHIHDLFKNYSISQFVNKPLPKRRESPIMGKEPKISLGNFSTQHTNKLTDFCFCLGKIWSVGLDYRVVCYNPLDFSVVSKEVIHSRGIIGVANYKNRLVTASKGGDLKVYNEQMRVKAHSGGVKNIAAIGDFLVTSNDSVKVWSDFKVIRKYSEKVSSVNWMPDGLFSTTGLGKILIWDIRCTGPVTEFKGKENYLKSLSWDEYTFWSLSENLLQVFCM